MFEEMEAFARSVGVIQLELAYAQGNERAPPVTAWDLQRRAGG